MCLILVAYRAHPDYELLVAANRDEFHDRPTAPLAFWEDSPHVLAGRDLKEGGTWMGITRAGCFAALTNYRDPRSVQPNAPSRGHLVSDYLQGDEPALGYLDRLTPAGIAARIVRSEQSSAGYALAQAGARPIRLAAGAGSRVRTDAGRAVAPARGPHARARRRTARHGSAAGMGALAVTDFYRRAGLRHPIFHCTRGRQRWLRPHGGDDLGRRQPARVSVRLATAQVLAPGCLSGRSLIGYPCRTAH